MIQRYPFHGGVTYVDDDTGLTSVGYYPAYETELIARKYGLFRSLVDELELWPELHGMPDMISFDHDLGGDDTAMKVVHFIINSWLDKTLEIPKNFEYLVHSANPVGAENIRGAMDRFLQEVNSES